MPFNFPIAQNRFGDLFSQGISEALGQYYQGKQLQRQGRLDEQNKGLEEFKNPGFHFGSPPSTPPLNLIDVAKPDPTSVSRMLTPGTDGRPSIADYQTGSVDTGKIAPNTPFQQKIAAAIPQPTGTHPSYIQYSGGYYDPDEAMARLRPQMMLNAQGEFLKSLMGAMGKAQGDPTETGLRTAQTNLANRNAGALRPGDPGYAPEMGRVAGAQANAKVDPETRQAIGIAQGTLGTKKDLAQYESGLTEGRDSRLMQQRVNLEASSPIMMRTLGTQFAQENNGLVQGVTNYAHAKTAIQEARSGNPAALKSALLAFAATADPKAQLRQGVMHEVMQVDPSWKGSLEMWLDKRANGQIPPRVLNAMDQMVDRVHQTNAGMYEQRRQDLISRFPGAQPFIAPTNALFGVPGVSNSTLAPSGGVAGKYGIKPSVP